MLRPIGIPAKICVAIGLFCALAIQAQVPGAPTLSSPANGATGQPTSNTLSWNTVSGATSYTLQVSQTSGFSSFVINQASLAPSSEIVSGLTLNTTYFWRVSATGIGGTSAWSNIWSFVSSISNAPILLTPANGTIDLVTSVTMNWTSSLYGVTYAGQVSTISSFASIISSWSGIAVTSASANSLSYSTTYYWRVNVTNSAGTSAWSSIWSFTTGQLTVSPTLVLPSNGATNQPLSLTISWNSVVTAVSYTLQVTTAANFSTTFSNQSGISATGMAISGLSSSTNYYYWRANALGPYGTSAWSNTYSFTTSLVIPAAPMLTYPSNNAADISCRPTFTWQGTNANTYDLELSTSSNFSTTIVSQTGLSSKDSIRIVLSYNSIYFWRMNAINSVGTSAWSSAWSFTVSGPPPTTAPVLISPATGSSIPATSPFSWGLVAGATFYTLQLNEYEGPNTQSSGYIEVDTSLSANNMRDSTEIKTVYEDSYISHFSWEVRANTGSGSGPWSNIWDFALYPANTLHGNNASSSPAFSVKNASLLYTLPTPSQVEVSLFNLTGRKFAILNRSESSGSYTLSLKNRNLPAGVYFLQFKAGAMQKRMKVVLPGG